MFLHVTAMILQTALLGVMASSNCPPQPSGLVDLGYAKHIPTFVNKTVSGHNVTIYKNIRFANAPTGNLRFRAPDTNLPTQPGIQDGHAPEFSNSCISSAPAFVPFPGINGTTWGVEDCLFLDVYVPDGVEPEDDVPVLHHFFGSAYAFGSKDSLELSPMGLFDRMFEQHEGKFIFVVNNYRLGIPGWTYAEGEDMDGNVGMQDCLTAAEWSAKYIKKFGGNGKKITTIGQSAGAGIINYLMFYKGGRGKLPFQQAFLSSIAAPARRNVTQRQQKLFDIVLDAANCTTLECLRSIPEEAMLALNDKVINHMPSEGGGGVLGPVLGFGPAPDGKTIPDLPLALLKKGQFHKDIDRLILGSMAYEGNGTSHDTDMPEDFKFLVRQILPTASDATIKTLQDEYYDPQLPPKTAWDWTTDVVFACNAYNLANALPAKSSRYIMSTPPATHGQDLFYYFNNPDLFPVDNLELVNGFQTRLIRFVNGQHVDWPSYGSKKGMYNITDKFEETTMPQNLQKRCNLLNEEILNMANGA